jgi:hypothetical protein
MVKYVLREEMRDNGVILDLFLIKGKTFEREQSIELAHSDFDNLSAFNLEKSKTIDNIVANLKKCYYLKLIPSNDSVSATLYLCNEKGQKQLNYGNMSYDDMTAEETINLANMYSSNYILKLHRKFYRRIVYWSTLVILIILLCILYFLKV